MIDDLSTPAPTDEPVKLRPKVRKQYHRTAHTLITTLRSLAPQLPDAHTALLVQTLSNAIQHEINGRSDLAANELFNAWNTITSVILIDLKETSHE